MIVYKYSKNRLIPFKVLAVYKTQHSKFGVLKNPQGITVDSLGNIYVADTGNHRIVKLTDKGKVIDTWGKQGQSAGEFKNPSGIAVDRYNNIYVADTHNRRIQKFNFQGEYIGEISTLATKFKAPHNVAVDEQGFIYVADTGNRCIKKFNSDAKLIKQWGQKARGKRKIKKPEGLYVSAEYLYVGDSGNNRIVIYSKEGKYIRQIKIKPWLKGNKQTRLVLSKKGEIYVLDKLGNRILLYSNKGNYLGCWQNSDEKIFFSKPSGITIDKQENIYIINSGGQEIVKIEGEGLN